MVTSQEIREKTFEKAVFGGYEMAGVDDFMEQVAADLALMQKENANLRGKMKVLAKSIEDYRSSEEAIRMAIVSAQKLSGAIEKEAREKSELTIRDASFEASKLTRDAKLQVELEYARLAEAKRASAQFIESMDLLCRKQLEYLDKLSGTDTIKDAFAQASSMARPAAASPVTRDEDPGEMHETVKSIEETVAKAASEPDFDIRPEIESAVGGAADLAEEDAAPTKAFDIMGNPDADDEGAFLFDGFGER